MFEKRERLIVLTCLGDDKILETNKVISPYRRKQLGFWLVGQSQVQSR
jgi:hypothetical protein